MKPFNLEEAKAGKPLVTRDGRELFFVAFDEKCTGYQQLILRTKSGNLTTRFKDGSLHNTSSIIAQQGGDVFMAPPPKKQVTVHLYRYTPTNSFYSNIEPLPDSYTDYVLI